MDYQIRRECTEITEQEKQAYIKAIAIARSKLADMLNKIEHTSDDAGELQLSRAMEACSELRRVLNKEYDDVHYWCNVYYV